MGNTKIKKLWKKVWHFIWQDDSIWSWIVNIILAFIIIKFIVYPGLGFVLGTKYPIVAVVSSSMEHRSVPSCIEQESQEMFNVKVQQCQDYAYLLCGKSFDGKQSFSFDEYWDICGAWYEREMQIEKSDFEEYRFKNGFNKGDIMILVGANSETLKKGEVIVFRNSQPDPIIHRIVDKKFDEDNYLFQTKGDNNPGSGIVDTDISEDRILGKAIIRVPYLGYVKIWAFELVKLLRAGVLIVLS